MQSDDLVVMWKSRERSRRWSGVGCSLDDRCARSNDNSLQGCRGGGGGVNVGVKSCGGWLKGRLRLVGLLPFMSE